MGLFKRKINKNAANQPRIVKDYFPSSIGVTGLDAYAFAAIDRIASEFASLGFGIYNTKDKQKTKKHSLYEVLKEPNLDERHFNFFYQSAIDYYNGGAFWLIRRYEGEVVSLFRLNPSQVVITRNANTNKREFLYNGRIFTNKEVIYIPSRFNYSTLTGGKSIFDSVPSAFSTSRKIEEYAQKTFDNAIGKRLVVDISALGDLTDSQITQLKEDFNAKYTGVENAGRTLFKKKGFEYSEIGSDTKQNVELADNRKIQKANIDNIFQMPSESFDTEKYFTFLNEFSIKPLAMQFQDAINSLLDEDKYFFEFDYNSVMKVSLTQRIDSYIKQINNGILSLDEVRAKENLSPIEAGETHFMPVNMMPWNEEIKSAYMAKQKSIAEQTTNPLDEDTQHIPQGDDKQ